MAHLLGLPAAAEGLLVADVLDVDGVDDLRIMI